MYKYIWAGFLGLTMLVSSAWADNQQPPAHEQAAMPNAGCAAPAGCQAGKSIDFVPVMSSYSPQLGVYAVIDSVDCAVDILRSTDSGLVRVGRFVTDSLEKRYDLANILRPKSVEVVGNNVLFLASSSKDSSYLGLLDLQGRLVRRIDLGCSSYAFGRDCQHRQIIVMGKNAQGYDFNFVSVTEGLSSMALAADQSYSYHKSKQSERIKESDPYGIGVTCVAVAVVFLALICIAIILNGYGKGIVGLQNRRAKKAGQPKGQTAAPGDVYAAIAAAIYLMNEEQHDDEEGVITINKVERAWTPWNAKFYNMNQYFKTRR